MVRPGPEVSFWFISFFIIYLMDSRSYNKLWSVEGILGLKSGLFSMDSSIGLLEIVPIYRPVGLWVHPEPPKGMHVGLWECAGCSPYKISVGPRDKSRE